MASISLALAQSPPPKFPVTSATRKNLNCWSKLPQDLLQIVFERLGFADFQRAKSVCSSWQFCSRESVPNNQIPWLILFPKDNNYCLLINPEEKGKVYKTQDLGNNFAKSFCLATSRSWLLMHAVDYINFIKLPQDNLYIFNLITREKINLPSFESDQELRIPVFWIDEKTKDYLVIGMYGEEYIIFFKKGNNSWKQTPQLSSSDIGECFNMVYKDHKLYCLNYDYFNIFNFSEENPLKVFSISVRGCVQPRRMLRIRPPGIFPCNIYWPTYRDNMVVTLGGNVLIVKSIRPSMSKIWEFEIYKIYPTKENKWEEIVSLGDEVILLDMGITVLAKDIEGIKRNSIYFGKTVFESCYEEDNFFIFNLDTKMVEQPHKFVCSSISFSNVRWFLPSFKRE